jgi:putative ABC transport system permease protein
MKVLKLVTRNALRHKLRTMLTILGLALAVMAFGLIRTFITAWYSGAEAASPNRLITRHAVSITFTLPIAYKEQLEKIEGVKKIGYSAWFGGIYIDPKNFFMQFATDHTVFFDLWPEFIVPPEQQEAFRAERRGAIVGRKLADRFGWKLGDKISIIGTIYPGNWDFIISGIYTGKDEFTDESQFVFRFDYLDEVVKRDFPGRSGQVGWFVLQIDDPTKAAQISAAIDARYKNSWAETITETEKEFQLSFIQMSGAIITGLRIISFLIIGVILMVLVNTMAMTARERIAEYAFMRTLGFMPYHLVGLILGESMFIAAVGGFLGMALVTVVGNVAGKALSDFFPVFKTDPMVYLACFVIALAVGAIASIFPIQRAVRIRIVDGLRVVD